MQTEFAYDFRAGSRLGRIGALGATLQVLFLLMTFCGMTKPALADTAVLGVIVDGLTNAPVEGAHLELRKGSQAIGATLSGEKGSFQLIVPIDPVVGTTNLRLAVTKEGYDDAGRDVVVTSGRTLDQKYDFVLKPRGLAECAPRRARRVVVGGFRPPIGTVAGTSDFTSAVSDALRHALQDLYLSRVSSESIPEYSRCAAINQLEMLPQVAKVLKADAVLAGSVARAAGSSKFDLTVGLGSQHGSDERQKRLWIMSPNVDLDRPTAARLSTELLSGVILGLITGYREAAQYSDCVEVARAAAQLFRKGLPDDVKAVVAQCMEKQPVAKLKLLGSSK